jgi:hypothetical protein
MLSHPCRLGKYRLETIKLKIAFAWAFARIDQKFASLI